MQAGGATRAPLVGGSKGLRVRVSGPDSEEVCSGGKRKWDGGDEWVRVAGCEANCAIVWLCVCVGMGRVCGRKHRGAWRCRDE